MYQAQGYFQMVVKVKQVIAASWDKSKSNSDGKGSKLIMGPDKLR